jgi:hypothetical protein
MTNFLFIALFCILWGCIPLQPQSLVNVEKDLIQAEEDALGLPPPNKTSR